MCPIQQPHERMNVRIGPCFSFQGTVESSGWYQMEPFHWSDDRLTRIDTVDGRPLLIEMSDAGDGVNVSTEGAVGSFKPIVERVFGLDGPMDDFIRSATDKGRVDLVDLVRRGHGRMLRGGSFFEDVIKTVFTINANWAYTKKMNVEFCHRYGKVHPSNGRRSFPTPEQVKGPVDINAGYRKATLDNVCQAFDGLNELYLQRRYEDLYHSLLEIKGIGPYAATHIGIMAGDRSRIPVDSWACTLMGIENDGRARKRINDLYHDEWGEHTYTAYKLETLMRMNK